MIYFIQSGRRDFVKIGFCAGDPQVRLGQLQVGNPEALRLVATKEGGKEAEAQWHERFAHLRVRGEWFKWDADLRYAAGPLIENPDAIQELRIEYARALVAGRDRDAAVAYEKLFAPQSWSARQRSSRLKPEGIAR